MSRSENTINTGVYGENLTLEEIRKQITEHVFQLYRLKSLEALLKPTHLEPYIGKYFKKTLSKEVQYIHITGLAKVPSGFTGVGPIVSIGLDPSWNYIQAEKHHYLPMQDDTVEITKEEFDKHFDEVVTQLRG